MPSTLRQRSASSLLVASIAMSALSGCGADAPNDGATNDGGGAAPGGGGGSGGAKNDGGGGNGAFVGSGGHAMAGNGNVAGASGSPAGGSPEKPSDVPSGCTATDMSGIAHPFGSHAFAYAQGSIFPSGDRASLDNATSAFYRKWKAIYVDQTLCSEGTHIVFHHFITDGEEITVSEAMGYGMVIVPLMAGCDPDARKIFDSMSSFVDAHIGAGGWLIWQQYPPASAGGACQDSPFGDADLDSATDGDLDVAFAYLLADAQWGSSGAVDYLAKAKQMLAAIVAKDMIGDTKMTGLGSSAEGDTKTRPSDWMLDHFRAFAKLDPAFWNSVLDYTYAVLENVQSTYSASTGLVPDYLVDVDTVDPKAAHPAKPGEQVQESDYTDSEVAYNSCRVPWHLGTDFVVSGDPRAKAAADRITDWIKTSTGGDPSKIIDGYKLDGSPGTLDPKEVADGGTHGGSLAFSSPFAVAAMTDSRHQAWLDALWRFTVLERPEVAEDDDYYGNTIKMIDLIILSGNWWTP
jgi:endo-1,4-beta-D-glucanase Y